MGAHTRNGEIGGMGVGNERGQLGASEVIRSTTMGGSEERSCLDGVNGRRSEIRDQGSSPSRRGQLVEVHAQQAVDQLGVGSLADCGQLAEIHT